MKKALYITADEIGTPTGGGKVTHNEYKSLNDFCEKHDWGIGCINGVGKCSKDPFEVDSIIRDEVSILCRKDGSPDLVHCYSGCLTKTISYILENNSECVITYTAAAHDKELSRLAHEEDGWGFHYPHLTDPKLWLQYLRGYFRATQVITPSTHSKEVMERYFYLEFGAGEITPIVVIPHGINLPSPIFHTQPSSQPFVVGYLGAIGPDKGINTLLKAWELVDQRDSVLLIAGGQSTSEYMQSKVSRFKGNVSLLGWLTNEEVTHFYNRLSVYVQPSITEGFGIEVLESLAHGRPVICSRGAGASDVLGDTLDYGAIFEPGDYRDLADILKTYKQHDLAKKESQKAMSVASEYTWDKIREKYIQNWESLVGVNL